MGPVPSLDQSLANQIISSPGPQPLALSWPKPCRLAQRVSVLEPFWGNQESHVLLAARVAERVSLSLELRWTACHPTGQEIERHRLPVALSEALGTPGPLGGKPQRLSGSTGQQPASARVS